MLRANKAEIVASWKWLASFTKRTWELSDYPIEVKSRNVDPDFGYVEPFMASITRWIGVHGFGKTPSDALRNLEETFDQRLKYRIEHGEAIPRPGARVSIKFAPDDKVTAYPDLHDHFVTHVLDLEAAWMSDESTLWDFHGETDCIALQQKIVNVYGVDTSDTVVIWEILHRIHAETS